MNETDFCNRISNAIHESFREENNGSDSDVFVDEVIDIGVIVLNWHVHLDCTDYCPTFDYVKRVAEFVFEKFQEVKTILSPCGDFERK